MALFVRHIAILALLAAVGILQLNAQEEGDVRLVNGPTRNCGRVEIFHNSTWGTICDDGWGYLDADVACRQLGYVHYERKYTNAYFGQGEGPIWLDNLKCSSSDNAMVECRHRGWGVHDCEHDEDAGVCCDRVQAPRPQSLPVRLICPMCSESCKECPDKLHPDLDDSQPQLAVSGIVQVQVDGVWGPLSAEYWTSKEASVVCSELGYPITFPENASSFTNVDMWPEDPPVQSGWSGHGSGCFIDISESCTHVHSDQLQQLNDSFNATFLQELECSGREKDLLSCFFSGIGVLPNPTHRVAAVQCGFKSHFSQLPPGKRTVRLRGGPVAWKGRVEVFKDGEWGTVCDTAFDSLEGNVVCKQLGYGSVKTIYGRGGAGRGVGEIHFSHCRCTSSESELAECGCSTGRTAERCGHKGDIGVECNVPQECSDVTHNMQVSMFESADIRASWITRTYPEIYMEATNWGLFCSQVVTKAVGEVICRETKGQFLHRISKSSKPTNYSGNSYSGSIICTGDEPHLCECTVRVFNVTDCGNEYALVECSTVAPDLVPDVERLQKSIEGRYYTDRLPLYYLQCAYEELCLSSSAYGANVPQTNERTLLRFDSMAWNLGLTDFNPVAARDDWIWHTCHNHYHSMEEFVHYNVIDETTGARVAEGHKASFCLEDSFCDDFYSPRYSCFLQVQGISVNCADLYGSHLDCQWIDITGVPVGQYLLQINLNPNRLAIESDYKNNQATCRVELIPLHSSLRVQAHLCWLSDH